MGRWQRVKGKKRGKTGTGRQALAEMKPGRGLDLRPGESAKELLCREYTLRQPAQTTESTPRWPHVLAAGNTGGVFIDEGWRCPTHPGLGYTGLWRTAGYRDGTSRVRGCGGHAWRPGCRQHLVPHLGSRELFLGIREE